MNNVIIIIIVVIVVVVAVAATVAASGLQLGISYFIRKFSHAAESENRDDEACINIDIYAR